VETIEQQKALADRILDGLKVISPYAILAGGAPRDWYFNEKANDLDFYLYTSAMTLHAAKKQLAKVLGIDSSQIKTKSRIDSSLYATMQCLRTILDVEGFDMPVQIMLLNKPKDEFKVVDVMSTSICKIFYHEGKIIPKQEFMLTVKTKIIFLDEGYSWSDPHPTKIVNRFKHKFTTATKERAMERLLDSLAEV